MIQWYTSFRTRVGKLKIKANKSGSGARNMTKRDAWIHEKGSFLHHTFQHTGTTLSSLGVSAFKYCFLYSC